MKIIETHEMTIKKAAAYARRQGLTISYGYLRQALSEVGYPEKSFCLSRQNAFRDPVRYLRFSRNKKKSGCKNAMGTRIYKKKNGQPVIKMRLQHTYPDDELSPVLERLAERIDKTKLYGFNGPRLGTNPKYKGNQATAIYLELDAATLLKMFEYLSISQQAA